MYDAFGSLAVQYQSGSASSYPCTTCYLTADQIGSTRLVTDQNVNVVARHDFLPFGEEITTTGGRTSQWGSTTDVSQKFTGQERDTESALDFFHARYYGSALNRFTSADPANAGADPGNPQSWNGYAYVWNSPMVNVDPGGMSIWDSLSGWIWNWFGGGGPQVCESFSDDSNCGDSGESGNPPPVDNSGWTGGGGLLLGGGTGALPGGGGGGGGGVIFKANGYGKGDVNTVGTPTKNGACSNLPAGTSPEFCAALQQGLQNALNALKRNRCGNFYGGHGPQTLDATQYRFLDMQNPNTGAATISPNNVFVNSKGSYMTYTPTPGQTGPFGRYWTQGQFRGFILLHELGHQLSPITRFKPDAGSPLNQQQSRQVLNACF